MTVQRLGGGRVQCARSQRMSSAISPKSSGECSTSLPVGIVPYSALASRYEQVVLGNFLKVASRMKPYLARVSVAVAVIPVSGRVHRHSMSPVVFSWAIMVPLSRHFP